MSSREDHHHHQAQTATSQLGLSQGPPAQVQGHTTSQDVPGNYSTTVDSERRFASSESQRLSLSPASASGSPRGALPPIPRTPPPSGSTFHPHEAEVSDSTPTTTRPPSSTVGLPPGARPTPFAMQTNTHYANRSAGSVHSTGMLPPPHALPTDSQPVMPHLNPISAPATAPEASDVPPPPPPRDPPRTAFAQTTLEPTLPPAPAHPALAIMRDSSVRSRAEPRRALSVSRGPSAVHASTLSGHDHVPLPQHVGPTGGGNGNRNTHLGNTYGPVTGDAYGSGYTHGSANAYYNSGAQAQRASYYTSATSTTPEKDRDKFFIDLNVPTSPSGRPLRLELPELPRHLAYSPPPAVGAAIRGVSDVIGAASQFKRDVAAGIRDARYAPGHDERYRDSGGTYGAHATTNGPYQPGGYNHTGYGTSIGYSANQDMTGNREGGGFYGGGGGGPPGGPGDPSGPNGMSGSAYFNAYSEIGQPRVPRTVIERLLPTLETVERELAKSQSKAQMTGLCLNFAIGLQVLLSAMITALSAVTSGRRTQVMTSVLGGAGTVVASYLARARGSNEPELSIARVKDLQRFQRACMAFVEDCGHETGWEGHEGYQPPPTPPKYVPKASQNEGKGILGLGWCMGRGIDEDARDMGRGADGASEKGSEKDEAVGGVPSEWDGGVRVRELDERIRRMRAELEHLLGNGNGERKLSQV